MAKFLLDAALSPETAEFLRRIGFNVEDLISRKLHHLPDEEKEGLLLLSIWALAIFTILNSKAKWGLLF